MGVLVSDERKGFIKYIDELYKPKFVYYPACGYDKVPKEVFGINNVIHLSLPENEPDVHYLQKLGEGIKLLGNMDDSPLADESVDIIWLNLHGLGLSSNTLVDFNRVLKEGGHIVIEELHRYEREEWTELLSNFSEYKKNELPEMYKSESEKFGIAKKINNGKGLYEGDMDEGEYLNSEEEVMNWVSIHKEYNGFSNILDYAVFEKLK
jgi:SAM-dependent methyltransferase